MLLLFLECIYFILKDKSYVLGCHFRRSTRFLVGGQYECGETGNVQIAIYCPKVFPTVKFLYFLFPSWLSVLN